MKTAISISQAISIIKESNQDFELTFVKSSDSSNSGDRGSLVTRTFRYGSPQPKINQPKDHVSVTDKKHLINGTIPLTDVVSSKYKTILISHIVGLNGQAVKH